MAIAGEINAEIGELKRQGFSIVRQFLPTAALIQLNEIARSQLAARIEPLELEADLQYPGAPNSREATGGHTVRRLLDAFGRDRLFAQWALADRTRAWMESYFEQPARLSRVHHNCLMTKHPRYGSLTGWHRDIRYWSFSREDLVSVWMALGEERIDNGALWFIPGSHRMALSDESFDAARFFRSELHENAELIKRAVSPRLNAGDAVLFHCNTLHSAGQNQSSAVKLSLVYTYHAADNPPRAGARSSSKPEVPLRAADG
ncbi:MAG TPA: phytanoyl-CoA dioxygenase family protein [Steroidobacteraceae bacterium]